jgi:NAD+ kinase
MILGLTGNVTKKQLLNILPPYVEWLKSNNIDYLVSLEFDEIPGLEDHPTRHPEEICEEADVILSFGGDGTLLNAIRRLEGSEKPVLGINLGGLGFLTDVHSNELYQRTQDLLNGTWEIEKRMILEISVESKSKHGTWYALNDTVIDKSGYARLIQLSTTIDDVFLNTFRADGLIISTPTGSTGYSLSAGGPILEPNMNVILLNPLNPHSLTNRPLLIGADKEIRVEVYSESDILKVSVDGANVCSLVSGDTLVVKKAKFSACLVNFSGRYFYDVLRHKLGWGDDRLKV